MKQLLFFLSLLVGLGVSAQDAKHAIVPIEKLQEAADRFAQNKWGNVGAADPIPYYDAYDNVIAYGFNYALGKDFPEKINLNSGNEITPEGKAKDTRWGTGEYGNLIMGNNLNRITMYRYINALSDEYAYADEIKQMASKALVDNDPVLEKVYLYNPLLKYYKYTSNQTAVYVRIFPPIKVLTESEFYDEYVSRYDRDELVPTVTPGAWEQYLDPGYKNIATNYYIPHYEVMPFLDWSYGCSPTSGGMLLGYWDNYSDYSSSDYGNLAKYHFHRSDPVQGDEDYNVTNAQLYCSVYMNTNLNTGGTSEGDIGPGIVDAANSSYCGSYSFSQSTSASWSTGANTTKLNLFKGEIDADRPCITSIPGHSTAAVGYEIDGANTFMLVHNTWNEGIDDHWNYTQLDRLISIYPGGQYGIDLQIISPNGDPGYNHNGNGEDIYASNVWEITWQYESYSGSYCKIYYSTNGGDSWSTITSNTPNDGSYLWTVPGITTSEGRVKVAAYSSTGTLIASDGSWGNFSIISGGSIITLVSDGAQTTTTDPTYYKLSHPYSTWGAVGVRTNDLSTTNWSLRFYDSDDFSNEVESSTWATNVDFVVFDQHHLSGTMRGVKSYLASGSGDGKTEFEGWTETISVSTPVTHSWPAEDVVEIWDVYLTPGSYKFTMEYNSGSANLDMALFSSYGGPYYQNRGDYVVRSTNYGTSDETFFVTISNYDYYGFIIWANDPNTANVTINIVPTTAGLWEGDVSTNWHTPGNWNDNNVPTSSTDVVIPSGTLYSPNVNTDFADAKTLTVESGAILTIHGYDLDVQDEVHVYGTIAITHINSDLYCFGDIYWESGSQASTTANGEFRIYGDWNFESGSNVQLTTGKVIFQGSSHSYIRCYEPTAYFHDVYSIKSGGSHLGVSALSTFDLTIDGDIVIYSGAKFNCYSSYKVILNGSFDNNGGNFICNYGTFEFGGNPLVDLAPNVGDYFNNLIVNVSSDVSLANTYSDSLVINGDLTIESGILKSNSRTIVIEGDWLNYVGVGGFWESAGKVIFDKSSGLQFCYGENFWDVTHNSNGGWLHFYGPTNIYNDFACVGNSWADEDMYIDNLNIGWMAKFTANPNAVVDIDDLDMGYTLFGLYMYGTIFANGGQIIVDDLVENGLWGTFKVDGNAGLLDITQGTTTGEYVDLNGTIEITGGVMNVNGGYTTSYWPYYANATITMSGGVLDFTDKSIRIHDHATYSLTTNLTGGTIRTDNSFYIYDTYNPAGGTLEFYGTSNSILSMGYAGCSVHDLLVNKTSGYVNCNTSTANISNNLTIDGGYLIPSDSLYIGGDWANNVGPTGFDEGTDVVCFYGSGQSFINTDETFYDLAINKTYIGYNDVQLETGLQINILGGFHAESGCLEFTDNTTADIDGALILENGGGFNVNNNGTYVYLGGNLNDHNTTVSIYQGFECDISNEFIFDGSSYQNIFSTVTEMTFGHVTLDKPVGTYINFADDVRILGHLDILGGYWDEYGANVNNYYVEGDFYVGASGAWTDYNSTLHFEGNLIQQYEYVSTSGYLGDVIINTTQNTGGVHLNSIFKILNTHNLTINNGQLWSNGNIVRIVGDVNINANGKLNLDDDSELQIGNSGHLNIYSGGILNITGTQNHEVILKSNDASYWQFNCYSGGMVAAEWATFTDLDTWGVYIYSNGIIDSNSPFDHCTFMDGEAGGSLLWINNSQVFTIDYANFPSQGSSSYNARKSFDQGEVTFLNYLGSFAGEANDNDPYNRLH